MNELEAITTTLAESELNDLKLLVEKATNFNKQHLEQDWITGGERSLHFLGYINVDEIGGNNKHFTLLPPALYRYDHEKKNWLGKLFRIAVLRYKDTMAIAAFFISVGLLLLRVLELAGYKLVFE